MMQSPVKKTFFYGLFVLGAALILTEVALRMPKVKSLANRAANFRPEFPSKNGIEMSAAAEEKIKKMLSGAQPPLPGKSEMSSSEIKNVPVSPLRYSKGIGPDLGGQPISSTKTETSTNKIIYDVKYKFDSYRRRLTVPTIDEGRSKGVLVFLGCSFIFGMGVQDSETIPSYIQTEVRNSYKVINLGIIAGGANDFLDDVTSGRRIEALDTKKGGVAVYSYFPIHRERTFCLADCYRDDWRRKLYLSKSAWSISKDFDVATIGTVKDSRSPLENFVRELFYNSEIGFLSQSFYSAGALHFRREYIKYIKALAKQWEKKNFKFVVYLLDTLDNPWTDEDINLLKENSVDYIYFNRSPVFSEVAAKGVIPGDDHFNSAGNAFRALQIVDGLVKKGYISL